MSTTNSNSILDVIAEKGANVEELIHGNHVKQALSDILRTHAKRERTLRESTITVRINEKYRASSVFEAIERKWTGDKAKPPSSYWEDKDFAYVQFISSEAKKQFLDYVASGALDDEKFKESIVDPNQEGQHIERKPIRVVINNVRANIKAERVEQIINQILGGKENGKMLEFKEGKPSQITNSRIIMFKTNGEGFKTLFGALDGSLPYTNLQTNTKTRLFLKVNCKPWTCRDCNAIGQHQCPGKLCGNCGEKDHITKECKQRTKKCSNCKRRGHRARDAHCSIYLNEVAKEIRKMAIPLEYLEDKTLRAATIKHMQIK